MGAGRSHRLILSYLSEVLAPQQITGINKKILCFLYGEIKQFAPLAHKTFWSVAPQLAAIGISRGG